MLTDKKAVIFDCDGTIADSMWVWRDIDTQFFVDHHIEYPETYEKEIEGMGFEELAAFFVERFDLEETEQEIMEYWTGLAIDRYQHKVECKPGFLKLFQYLKENGFLVGIATSNSRELLMAFLNAKKIAQLFDVIVTAAEVNRGKPEPDIYLLTAEKLGVSVKDCLVFEDLPNGILAGKRAGMTVCGVDDPYSEEYVEEKKELSDYYIYHFDEVKTGF